MTHPLTSAEMRGIERRAIAEGLTTGLDLMETAGEGVVEAICKEWPDLARGGHSAVVLCGPGNNGGDGFVVARLLANRGWSVKAVLYGDPDALPPDARINFDRWGTIGEIIPIPDQATSNPPPFDPPPDLWIDAIFGIGLNRPLPDPVTRLLHRVHEAQLRHAAPIVAIDIPSGLNADTGLSVQPTHLTAALTVTFHRTKIGHTTGDGPRLCGKVVVKSIGL